MLVVLKSNSNLVKKIRTPVTLQQTSRVNARCGAFASLKSSVLIAAFAAHHK